MLIVSKRGGYFLTESLYSILHNVLFFLYVLKFFFFSSRRRHTRYWRDWSSDVCSSDLIAEGASFTNDLDADSLAMIQLVEDLEKELGERVGGFRIEDEDLEDLKTVRDAVDRKSVV